MKTFYATKNLPTRVLVINLSLLSNTELTDLGIDVDTTTYALVGFNHRTAYRFKGCEFDIATYFMIKEETHTYLIDKHTFETTYTVVD